MKDEIVIDGVTYVRKESRVYQAGDKFLHPQSEKIYMLSAVGSGKYTLIGVESGYLWDGVVKSTAQICGVHSVEEGMIPCTIKMEVIK